MVLLLGMSASDLWFILTVMAFSDEKNKLALTIDQNRLILDSWCKHVGSPYDFEYIQLRNVWHNLG